MCIDGCPCTKDADGCFMTCTKPPADPCALLKCTQPTPKCVVQGGLATCQAECSAAQPCAKGSLCKAGACEPDPCAATTCGSATAHCVVTAAFTASCEDACSADQPCTGSGKLCRDGSCQTSPCAAATCAEPTPKCVVTPEFAARCEAECGAGKPACPTGKLCSKGACKPDPCLAARCAEPTPKCSLTADFKAKCEAECGAGKPACPSGKLCSTAAGRCKANPCLALRCTEPTPKCVVAPDFRARCEPECGAGKPACPSGTVCSSGRCKPCVTKGTAASLLGSFFRPLCAPGGWVQAERSGGVGARACLSARQRCAVSCSACGAWLARPLELPLAPRAQPTPCRPKCPRSQASRGGG